MPLTDAQICNLALGRIGHRESIASLNEDTEAARMSKIAYQPSLDAVLSSFDWSFARRHVDLSLLTETRPGWAYAYALPADYVQALYLFNGARPGVSTVDSLNSRADCARGYRVAAIPYGMEASASGTGFILVTDAQAPSLAYTARVSTAALPPLVVQALAWLLAMELSLSLSVQRDVAQAAEGQYARKLAEAQAQDANTEQADVPPDAEAVTVRG